MRALLEQLQKKEKAIGEVGLGSVGLPLAFHMSRRFRIIGYDVKEGLVEQLKNGLDETGEVDNAELKRAEILFTTDPSTLREALLIIVAVPTPIDEALIPDLGPLIRASRTIGNNLRPGAVVVYESTVFPGVTEEICGPVLEEHSGLESGTGFLLGYSPERINPGDKKHAFDRITKVVSGQTPEVLEFLAQVYGAVVKAGIHRAPDIRTAEAAKVIENTQRDLNIALMNELAVIFNMLNIDTKAVLEAAGTKWNFLNFKPGLVGGHCIGVDPYYLTYLAQKMGYHPKVILAGRQINDGMSKFVVEQTIKRMIRAGIGVSGSRILVLGLTFKEDVPDLRNSKVFEMVQELREYNAEILLHDPMVSEQNLMDHYGERKTELAPDLEADTLILAVGHKAYHEMGLRRLADLARPGALFVDVKSIFEQEEVEACDLSYWRL